MSLSGHSRGIVLQTCKLQHTIGKNNTEEQKRGVSVYRGKERGCLEGNFIGGEREFRVVVASHCCWVGRKSS